MHTNSDIHLERYVIDLKWEFQKIKFLLLIAWLRAGSGLLGSETSDCYFVTPAYFVIGGM